MYLGIIFIIKSLKTKHYDLQKDLDGQATHRSQLTLTRN